MLRLQAHCTSNFPLAPSSLLQQPIWLDRERVICLSNLRVCRIVQRTLSIRQDLELVLHGAVQHIQQRNLQRHVAHTVIIESVSELYRPGVVEHRFLKQLDSFATVVRVVLDLLVDVELEKYYFVAGDEEAVAGR
jgi:hypothetical protein